MVDAAVADPWASLSVPMVFMVFLSAASSGQPYFLPGASELQRYISEKERNNFL